MRRTLRTLRTDAARHIDPPALRVGSEDALRCASRTGNWLRHRDGRITDLSGNPLPKGQPT